MKAEEYLNKISLLDELIQTQIDELERLKDKCYYKPIDYSQPRVQYSRTINDAMAETVALNDIFEKPIMDRIRKYSEERQSIIDDIYNLNNARLIAVVYGLFVNGDSYQEIARKQNRSTSWVKDQRKEGLKEIQNMLDSRGAS